jgi:hypothetical protein
VTAPESQLPLIRDIRGGILFGVDGNTYWWRNTQFEQTKAWFIATLGYEP